MRKFLQELRDKSVGEIIMSRVRAFLTMPPYDEPWPKELDDAVRRNDAVLVCHHCLTPQSPTAWFCPNCGAAVGPYNNCMPYLNIFSEGEVLRSAVKPGAHYTKLTMPGYLLYGVGTYAIFAPVYYYRMIRNWSIRRKEPPAQNELPANGDGND